MNENGIWSVEEAGCYHRFDNTLVKCIVDTFKQPSSVIDIGCGKGQYCDYFSKVGWKNITGYEGTPNTWGIFNNIKPIDLSLPCNMGKSDFVICLEVGEHIPEKYEYNFIKNVANTCSSKLIISWATPGQGGPGHVNCKSNEYIIEKFFQLGFTYNKRQSEDLRQNTSLSWFKGTIMVFDKKIVISVMTMWYNEEFLAPFFLEHYKYVDKIHIIMDADTTDKSREIALKYPNVTIEEYKFPDGMNDILRKQKFNDTAQTIDTNWLYIVDADEFIFPPKDEDPREFLRRQHGNVVVARMWYVFRNIKDKDLDSTILPIHHQRRHGDSNRETGGNALYNSKPVVLRMPLNFELGIGSHSISGENLIGCNESFDGAHWQNADPKFVIERKVKNRKNRHSQINRQNRFGFQDFSITEEQIINTYKEHINDPQLF